MNSGASSGSLADEDSSDDDQLVQAIEEAIYRLDLSSPNDVNKYFAGFNEMATLVKKRPDLIDDSLFHVVFKYIKAYFEETKDRKCTEHLVALLVSGNQYNALNLELVFLWAFHHDMAEALEEARRQEQATLQDSEKKLTTKQRTHTF